MHFGMNENIPALIKFLERNNLITFDILGKSEAHFLNRFKIQKYVYFAQRYGIDLPYNHSIYLRGPYSTSLTRDYYFLANNRDTYDNVEPNLPQSFENEEFLTFLRDKDEHWLEIATTLLDRSNSTSGRAELIEKVFNIKEGYSAEFISQVLTDLETEQLVTTNQ